MYTKHTYKGNLHSAPTPFKDFLIYYAGDSLTALDPVTGRKAWEIPLTEGRPQRPWNDMSAMNIWAVFLHPSVLPLITEGDMVFFKESPTDSQNHAVNTVSRAIRWDLDKNELPKEWHIEMNIDGTFLAGPKKRLKIAKSAIFLPSEAVFAGPLLLIASYDTLFAINKKTGKTVWKFEVK